MWLYTFFGFSGVVLVRSYPAPTHLLVTRVGPCEDEPQDVVLVSELKISTQTYDSSLSGTLNVTEDIKNGWKLKVTIKKCLDIRNIDTCDHFKSFFLVQNGCKDDAEAEDEQDIYGMLFHYVNPKLECPIKSGFYHIFNYPFFTEDNYVPVYEAKISTSVFGYIYTLHGYSINKHKILCVEAHVQLIYIRDHNWMQNKDLESTTMKLLYAKLHDEDDKSDDSNDY